jgi:ubiquinone/menaquinone biosynthesis C-methylase UbiE
MRRLRVDLTMSHRGYQLDFAREHGAMYDIEGRRRKAVTLLAVMADVLGPALSTARVLNVGCSTGIMDAMIAPHVGSLLGLDIDEAAITHAVRTHQQDKLEFRVGDAMAMDVTDATIDLAICSQVYEHVPDPARMLREIHRVLRPGGHCYFAATNRLRVLEQHHRLPFLSIVPIRLAHRYMRLAGKGRYYYERHYTYWTLRHLVGQFELIDYTKRILRDPVAFKAEYMLGAGGPKLALIRTLAKAAYWAFPGYIWVLRRPA